MKLGIVGLGYWGKNIFNTLCKSDHELVLCDPFLKDKSHYSDHAFCGDYRDLDCDLVYVVVPAGDHHEVCKHFLSQGTSVFCEKPLCLTLEEAEDLYSIAEKSGCYLMVDWIFSFSNELNFIKSEFENRKFGDVKHVSSKRLNAGIVRRDTNAKWDLSSHDVSIITYLFNKTPHSVYWADARRNADSEQCDTSMGILSYDSFYALIHSSWEYPRARFRDFSFEFERCVVEWNDTERTVTCDGEVLAKELSGSTPLENSTSAFLSMNEELYIQQKDLTLKTTSILCR